MQADSPPSLPPPRPDQIYVSVSTIPGGWITLPDKHFVTPADKDAKRTVPSLSFLIRHPGPNRPFFCTEPDSPQLKDGQGRPYNFLFDLGLRSSLHRYMPAHQRHLEGSRQPYRLTGVAAQLASASGNDKIDPVVDIDAVVLSHVHYDHHGDPEDFPNSTFVVGAGALGVLKEGLHGKGGHQHFEPELLSRHRTIELPAPSGHAAGDRVKWMPLGPFASALDMFDDGSVFIVDMPGHLPGHINLLCRVSEKRWICLCGDAFHDKRLLTGEKEIGTWYTDGVELCIHLDKKEAKESIKKLRQLVQRRSDGVEIDLVAAHDEAWFEEHQAGIYPGTL